MKIPPQKTYRYEKKCIIDEKTRDELMARCRALMKPDQNAGGRYRISSLYFDDYYNASYYEKQNGVLVRSKLRARWYNGDESFARLEEKHKYGEMVHKAGAQLTAGQLAAMRRADYGFMRGSTLCRFLHAFTRWTRRGACALRCWWSMSAPPLYMARATCALPLMKTCARQRQVVW